MGKETVIVLLVVCASLYAYVRMPGYVSMNVHDCVFTFARGSTWHPHQKVDKPWSVKVLSHLCSKEFGLLQGWCVNTYMMRYR